jgi:hypothetical protein
VNALGWRINGPAIRTNGVLHYLSVVPVCLESMALTAYRLKVAYVICAAFGLRQYVINLSG